MTGLDCNNCHHMVFDPGIYMRRDNSGESPWTECRNAELPEDMKIHWMEKIWEQDEICPGFRDIQHEYEAV